MRQVKKLNPPQKKAVMQLLQQQASGAGAPRPPGPGAPMPMAPGMRKGGSVRRFAGGGDTGFEGEIENLTPNMSFKEAFADARGSKAKTFTWNGKSYTTELAKPGAASAGNKPSGGGIATGYGAAAKRTPTLSERSRVEPSALRKKWDALPKYEGGMKKGGFVPFAKKGADKGKDGKAKWVPPWAKKTQKMASGGSVVYAAGGRIGGKGDGCISRGATKGRMC